MKKMSYRFRTLTTRLLCAGFAVVMVSGCGETVHDSPPGAASSLTLTATSPTTPEHNRRGVTVRRNGRDTLHFEATVTGLSTQVAFNLAEGFGTFRGGILGADGWRYYEAARNGVASGDFVSDNVSITSTGPGATQLMARSLDQIASLDIFFDYATLAIFPTVLTIPAVNSTFAHVYARGALPPVEWWLSDNAGLSVTKIDPTTATVAVHNMAAFTTTTLYCRDSEGQSASITVSPGTTTCDTADLTLNPSSGSAAVGTTTTTVTLSDTDLAGQGTAVLAVTGPGVNTSVTVTESPSVPGFFSGTFTVPATKGAFTFSISDQNDGCQPALATVTMTIGT